MLTDTMPHDVVLGQFLWLKPMSLDDDAAPSERHAAQQHGSGRRAGNALPAATSTSVMSLACERSRMRSRCRAVDQS